MGPGCVPCLRTLWVGSSEAGLGAQRPVARPAPGGGPAFFGRKPGERTPGLRPGPGFLWPLVATRWVLGSLSLKRSRGYFLRDAKTDLGRIFEGNYAGKHFCERKFPTRCVSTPPKPSPWGEGGPAKPGRMRGRSIGPTGREKEGVEATGPSFYKERLGTGSPPHQSPPVTASPQGEAYGLCSPTRKSVPNQGTQMGSEIAPPSEQCAPPRQNERASSERALNPGGAGGHPPRLFASGLSPRESLDPPPGTGRGTTSQVWTCAGPAGTPCRRHPPSAKIPFSACKGESLVL